MVASAIYAQRYLTERKLPDKAFDLLDEAASRLRMQLEVRPRSGVTGGQAGDAHGATCSQSVPEDLRSLENELMAKQIELVAIGDEKTARAGTAPPSVVMFCSAPLAQDEGKPTARVTDLRERIQELEARGRAARARHHRRFTCGAVLAAEPSQSSAGEVGAGAQAAREGTSRPRGPASRTRV